MNALDTILALMLTDPLQAADRLDDLARKLTELAVSLRIEQSPGYLAPGGMGDRVKVQVFGPDGTIKQDVSTN
jgi:hypothetical protein